MVWSCWVQGWQAGKQGEQVPVMGRYEWVLDCGGCVGQVVAEQAFHRVCNLWVILLLVLNLV